jgi:hypothetical protein
MSVRLLRQSTVLALAMSLFSTGIFGSSNAYALEICVNSASALQSAFSLGQLQSSAYKIKLAQGLYALNSGNVFEFSAPTTLEGGYSSNCSSRTVDPANTVVSIGSGHPFDLRQLSASPVALLSIDGITFQNGNQGVFLGAGSFGDFSNDEGKVVLTRSRFTQLAGGFGGLGNTGPVTVQVFDGEINIENVIFDHLNSSGTCGVSLLSQGGAYVRLNHVSAELPGGDDFCMDDDNDSSGIHFSVSNSILWSADGGQTIFRAGTNSGRKLDLDHDIYQGQLSSGGGTITSPINSAPGWIDPVNGNYRLKTSPLSPAINSGTTAVTRGEPATDIEGHLRIIGSAPDRGAYESAFNNQSTLTVTNAFDSGAGSLRQAMLDANSSPAIAHAIKFDIRGANQVPTCPAVIALNSTLPAIDSTVFIDGYSQLLSTPNTSVDSFNANLCIMIKPASGTLSNALRVLSSAGATASLTLRGVGLGGFGQPLVLLGGKGHVIAGNQLGSVAHGISLPGASLSAITIGVNASGSLIIGGINAADRNVIGGAGVSGISIQSTVTSTPDKCQIVNNLIGLDPNGILAAANNFGIDASGLGCSIVGNRIAGNSIVNLWIQGADNIAQQNLIGFNIQDNGFFTDTTGILVTGSGNVIGAGGNGGSITANTMRYNIAGGIVVKGDSATGNSINANRIYDNGGNSNGMDIDLIPTGGASGPTPNDSSDLDSGPNDLQNFPLAKGLVYTAPGSIDRPAILTAQLVSQPGFYRIDAYFSNATNSLGKRGHAEVILAHTNVQVPDSGRVTFSLPILVPNQSVGGVVSLTATDNSFVGANFQTSEIGPAMSTDRIFADGIE